MGWIAPLPQRHLQFAPCGFITVLEVYPVIPVISGGFFYWEYIHGAHCCRARIEY
jgi:hypothetical protein